MKIETVIKKMESICFRHFFPVNLKLYKNNLYIKRNRRKKLGTQNNMEERSIVFFLTSWPHQHGTVINQFSPGRSSLSRVCVIQTIK